MSRAASAVSIIVPVFNAEDHIDHCINSILKQTLHEIEVIVVDDCSTDGTAAVAKRWADQDSRIVYIRQEHNAGVHSARATGIRNATHARVGFVDADDWIDSTMFEKLSNTMTKTGSDIVICSAYSIVNTRKRERRKVDLPFRKTLTSDTLGRFCRFEFGSGVLWNKLYKKEIIETAALTDYKEIVPACEDYIVNIGAFSKARRVSTIPEPLYYYRENPTGASLSHDSAKRFTRTLRAYLISLRTHLEDGESVLANIDLLFQRQFHFPNYQTESLSEFSDYKSNLADTLKQISEIRPESIYPLIHAYEHRRSGTARLPLAHRVYKKIKNKLSNKK